MPELADLLDGPRSLPELRSMGQLSRSASPSRKGRCRKLIATVVGSTLLACLLVTAGAGAQSAGAITTGGDLNVFAGTGEAGPAVEADRRSTPVSSPKSLAEDGAGNVYILTGEPRVLRVDHGTGAVTFLAGNGHQGPVDLSAGASAISTPLNAPTQIAADAEGNVYIADPDERVLRVAVDGSTSFVTDPGVRVRALTVAPNGVLYYFVESTERALHWWASPELHDVVPMELSAQADIRGLAVNDHGDVFLSNAHNTNGEEPTDSVLELPVGETILVARAFDLVDPGQLALDGDGDLYVAAVRYAMIIKVATPALFSGLATPVAENLSSPGGVAVNPSGDILIAERGTHRVLELDASTPSAPLNLVARARDTSAELTFDAPSRSTEEIQGYEYTSDNGATWQALSPVSPGTVTGLSNGTQYSFKVRALTVSGSGGPSATSNVVRPAAALPAGAPTGLGAVAGNHSVTLSFTAPVDDGGAPIQSFDYSFDGVNWLTLSYTGGPAVTGTVTGLTSGTAYVFQVQGWTSAGSGYPSSASASVTPYGLASAPTNLTATAGNTGAGLAFTVPANGGSPITGYEYNLDDHWTALANVTVSGSNASVTVTGLVNGIAYSVRVRAVTVAGPGPGTANVSVTPVAPVVSMDPPAVIPGAPSTPTVVLAGASVAVSWSAPSRSAGITGYTVSASPGPATCSTSSVGSTSCVIGTTAGISHTYRVVAHSAVGDSPPSGPSVAVTTTLPELPTTVPVSAPTTLTTPEGSLHSVVRSQPVTIVGSGFAAFSTARVVMYSTPIVLATVTTDANGSFSVDVVVPAGLAEGPHNFVATGVSVGGSERLIRMPVELVPDPSPFAGPPTAVKITVGRAKLTATFNPAVARAGLTVSGYQLSGNGGKSWMAVHPIGATRQSVTVTGLKNGTSYLVQLRAVTSAGVGIASAGITAIPVLPWFRDPISAAGRKGQAKVPAHPKAYTGTLRTTKAAYRSHNGTLAVPAAWAVGHQLGAKQAVTLSGTRKFKAGSAVLTKSGAKAVKLLGRSLTDSKAVTCESYADYAAKSARAKTLSAKRAKAICGRLKAYGAKVTTTSVGYGIAFPVTIGGKARDRVGNYRVIVLVTKD